MKISDARFLPQEAPRFGSPSARQGVAMPRTASRRTSLDGSGVRGTAPQISTGKERRRRSALTHSFAMGGRIPRVFPAHTLGPCDFDDNPRYISYPTAIAKAGLGLVGQRKRLTHFSREKGALFHLPTPFSLLPDLSQRGREKAMVLVASAFTWLILPVVICLSQRLSHASVSTCRQMAKPRTAH